MGGGARVLPLVVHQNYTSCTEGDRQTQKPLMGESELGAPVGRSPEHTHMKVGDTRRSVRGAWMPKRVTSYKLGVT